MNVKYTYPNVISASPSLFVTSFMAICHGNLLPDPFQQRRGFSGFLLFMVCGTVWAYGGGPYRPGREGEEVQITDFLGKGLLHLCPVLSHSWAVSLAQIRLLVRCWLFPAELSRASPLQYPQDVRPIFV